MGQPLNDCVVALRQRLSDKGTPRQRPDVLLFNSFGLRKEGKKSLLTMNLTRKGVFDLLGMSAQLEQSLFGTLEPASTNIVSIVRSL